MTCTLLSEGLLVGEMAEFGFSIKRREQEKIYTTSIHMYIRSIYCIYVPLAEQQISPLLRHSSPECTSKGRGEASMDHFSGRGPSGREVERGGEKMCEREKEEMFTQCFFFVLMEEKRREI